MSTGRRPRTDASPRTAQLTGRVTAPRRTRRIRWRSAAPTVSLLAAAALTVVGCGRDAAAPTPTPSASDGPVQITVTSTAFAAGGSIPTRFTCDGVGTAPPLAWSGVPDGTQSVALVVDDPDAPDGTYTHWVVGGLSPRVTAIGDGGLPPSAVQAVNSAGRAGYSPPCPPSGTHHYRFTVLALQVPEPFEDGAATSEALAAIHGASTARGTLVGRYTRR